MATSQRPTIVREIVESARVGGRGVWKLIYWNLLAILARVIAGIWIVIAVYAYLFGSGVSTPVGYTAGIVTFAVLPVVYGAVVRWRR